MLHIPSKRLNHDSERLIADRSASRYACISLSYAAFFFVFIGCDSTGSGTPKSLSHKAEVSLRRGLGGDPATLDPAKAVDTFSFEVLRDLYEGLTAESAGGEILPGVAKSWTADEFGTQYRFTLRADARWSNGELVRATDFVLAWRRVVDPSEASPVADVLRPISNASSIIAGISPPNELGVYAPSDNLLIVNLERPAPYFPQLLTHSATFPVYGKLHTKSDPKNLISNGAYTLSSWTPGAALVLRRNPSYWNRAQVQIDTVTYVPIADENAELRQYRAGQLDLTQSVPTGSLKLIRGERPNEFHAAPFLGIAYYALNLHDTIFRKNGLLRQALAMAIDRKMLVSTILPFGQTPAYGFVPNGTWNYESQSWDWHNMGDIRRNDEARRLYGEAGYSQSHPLKLRLLYNSNEAIRLVTIAIATMWKQTLGVETELVNEEYRVFLQSRQDKNRWDVLRLGWTADYNDAANFLDTFRQGSPNNDAGYENPQFEILLDKAAVTADPQTRRKLLESAELQMLSDYPIIPIYFYSSRRLIKPFVTGFEPNPLNRLYSKHLTMNSH